jgi:hypothetical protein
VFQGDRDDLPNGAIHQEPGFFTVYAKVGRILRYEGINVNRAEVKAMPSYTLIPVEYVDVLYPLGEVLDRAGNRVL